MASEPEEVPPAEDTVVGEEAVTQVDEEWPVAELYVVDQDDESVVDAEPAETSEIVVLTQTEPAAAGANRRWIPPSAGTGLMLAIAGTIAALILVAVLVGLRDDQGTAASTAPVPTTSSPPGDPTGGSTTPVPEDGAVALRDLEGMSLANAESTLAEDGLRVIVRRLDSDRPRGEVVTQDPPPGTAVTEGDRIVLVVSRGAGTDSAKPEAPASVQVPRVVGRPASDAVAAIRNAGFEARVRLVTSPQPSGTVIRQSPPAESEASNGSTVVLDVAKSRPVVQRIEVPDVVGNTAAAARRALRSAGLNVTIVTVESSEPQGTVVQQSPSAGTDVRKGASVELGVSGGQTQLDVPDVTGLDEQSARLELTNAGFEVRMIDQSTTDPTQDGVVLDQTPASGTKASEGAVVTLRVGRLG